MGTNAKIKGNIILILFILTNFQIAKISTASTIVIDDINNPVFIDATEPSNFGTTYTIIDGENNIHVISSDDNSNDNFIINKNEHFDSDTNFTQAYAVQIDLNEFVVYIVELRVISGFSTLTNSYILKIQNKNVVNISNFKIEYPGARVGLFLFQDKVYLTYHNNSGVEISRYYSESNKLEIEFNSNEVIHYNSDGNSTFEGLSVYEDFLLIGINYWHNFNSTSAYYVLSSNQQLTLEVEHYDLIPDEIFDVSIFQDTIAVLTENTLYYVNILDFYMVSFKVNSDYQTEIVLVGERHAILKTHNRLELLVFLENDYINIVMSAQHSINNYYNNLVSDMYVDANYSIYIAYVEENGDIILYSDEEGKFFDNIAEGTISYQITTQTSVDPFPIGLPIIIGIAVLFLGVFVFIKNTRKQIGPKYAKMNKKALYEEQQSETEIGLKVCEFCGRKNEYQDIFCSNCGNKLE
ncbi:MAG: hypothetical protein HeimC3_13570 [Candidatus Heimdallarchaeota archaeon LC_3]|nr:MAG: hypothetical protein HeimC3_13570 [Candidatus Heimdallarchaeota archaeon LC_3]